MQRLTPDGDLLALDGSVRASAGSGYLLDSTNLDQVTLGLTGDPHIGETPGGYTVVYARQASQAAEADFDIWASRIQVAEPWYGVSIPLVLKN